MPSSFITNFNSLLCADPVFRGDFFKRTPRIKFLEDNERLPGREFGMVMILAFLRILRSKVSLPVFRLHVREIFLLCPEPKMGWVAALPVIATMAYKQFFGINFICQGKCKPMAKESNNAAAPSNVPHSISDSVQPLIPRPALALRSNADFRPKSFYFSVRQFIFSHVTILYHSIAAIAFLIVSATALPQICAASFSEFYMVTTGSNTNAGSTTDNAALILSSSGSWGAAGTLNRYISTAAVFGTASIGQMASIYFATTTGNAVFISSIVAVISNTTIDLDTTTIFYGVKPSTSATNQYACKIGGAWGDLGVLGNIFNARTVTQSTRINIKAGTYANTSNTRTFGSNGGNGNLIWWRGYKTTPGDQDSNNLAVAGTDIPNFTWTTGNAAITGSNQIFSNLQFISANTAATGTVDDHAANLTYYRCRIINSSNVANGFALVQNSAGFNTRIQSCYIQADILATNAIQCAGAGSTFLMGSVINGGSISVSLTGAGSTMYGNIIYGSGSNAVNVGGTGPLILISNSVYQPVGNGFNFNGPSSLGSLVFNNYFENVNQSGKAAISLAVATNTVNISGNAYSGCTLNISTTVTEGFTIYDNTTSLSQAAFISPSNQNFSILPVAQGIAYPSLFENLSNDTQGYVDAGAKQHKGIAGGGFSVAN